MSDGSASDSVLRGLHDSLDDLEALYKDIHSQPDPVVAGGGKRALRGGVRADLELVSERRFESGVVHLHYRAAA